LPLFELRKRLDLVLHSVLKHWIFVGSKDDSWDIATLRKNCLKLPKSKCEGACAWITSDTSTASSGSDTETGACLIHTTPTERFVDPAFVITARIVDELLRTYEPAMQVLEKRVPRLRPPVGIVREKDSFLLSFEGRGDTGIFKALGLEGRLPTRYTQGLVIPEELGAEDVGCEGSSQGIPLTWVGITQMIWPAKATGQALREIAWAGLLDAAWKDLEKIWKTKGEFAFCQAAADITGMHILFTKDTCHGYQLVSRISPASNTGQQGQRMFVILTPDRLPLASAKTKQPRIAESELPTAILQWLDESSRAKPAEVEELVGTVETEEESEEVLAPYAILEAEERQRELEEKRAAVPVVPKPVNKPAGKPCPEGEERSLKSKKCIKKCKEDE
jgi:hypothetical protein